MSILLVDVGGHVAERKRWLNCFDSVAGVMFVAALSGYDEPMEEDSTKNCLHESIELFSSVCHNRWFSHSCVLLFLNKKDVFDEKISYSPLNQCFADYNGSGNKEQAADFILQQFNMKHDFQHKLYHHFTHAKDTKNVSAVFDMVTDSIAAENCKSMGLV